MLRSAAYSETAANRANMKEKIFFMMFLILVKHMLLFVGVCVKISRKVTKKF